MRSPSMPWQTLLSQLQMVEMNGGFTVHTLWKGRSGKACGHNPDVYAAGKSDRPIVPRKFPNKAGAAASGAEEAEGRGLAKENALGQNPPIGPSAIPGWSNAAKSIR